MEDNHAGLGQGILSPSCLPIPQLYEEYLSYSEIMKGLSPETSQSKRVKYNYFFRTSKVKRPDDITQESVEKWIILMAKSKKWKPRTIRLYLTYLSSFCDWLVETGKMKENPIKAIPRPKLPKLLPKAHTKAEMDQLFVGTYKYPNPRRSKMQAVIALILYTGVRRSELLGLMKKNVTLSKCYIKVVEGKGGKDRIIYYPPKLNYYLRQHLDHQKPGDWFFMAERTNAPMSGRVLQQYFVDLRETGVRSHPHKIRHTYATRMLESGMTIRELADLMGHSNIETTAIYTRVFPERIKERMREIDY